MIHFHPGRYTEIQVRSALMNGKRVEEAYLGENKEWRTRELHLENDGSITWVDLGPCDPGPSGRLGWICPQQHGDQMPYNGEDMIGDDGFGTHAHHIRTKAEIEVIRQDMEAIRASLGAAMNATKAEDMELSLYTAHIRAASVSSMIYSMIIDRNEDEF
jgi:hypothetical protein